MAVTVTNSGGTIKIDDGQNVNYPQKNKVDVSAIGDNVIIRWDDVHYVSYPYSSYSSPSGASAAAVAALIAAFLNTGAGANSNVVTVSYTIGMPGVTGVDQNFTSAANTTEQSLQLGSSAIIPANSPITSIVLECTEAPTGGVVTADVGNTSGGDEWMSVIDMGTLNNINSVSTQVAAKVAASSIYVSMTPGSNWNTYTAGKYKVWITYADNSNN